MEYQIAIYSTDAVFARMLELEFCMRGMTVLTAQQPLEGTYADVVLLDLDSAHTPAAESYRRMIGFTRGSAQSADDDHRQCSMILHRPFEMRLLRREVLGEGADGLSVTSFSPKPARDMRMTIDVAHSCLTAGTQKMSLSPKELQVMQCLLENRGTAVSRERIASVIGESSANKTDVYVCFLRRKLEETFGDRLIKTERAKGYLIP